MWMRQTFRKRLLHERTQMNNKTHTDGYTWMKLNIATTETESKKSFYFVSIVPSFRFGEYMACDKYFKTV